MKQLQKSPHANCFSSSLLLTSNKHSVSVHKDSKKVFLWINLPAENGQGNAQTFIWNPKTFTSKSSLHLKQGKLCIFLWYLGAHKTQALLQTTRILLHITQKQKQSFPESQLPKQNKNKANFTHQKSSNKTKISFFPIQTSHQAAPQKVKENINHCCFFFPTSGHKNKYFIRKCRMQT